MLFLASLQVCALNLGGRVLTPGSQGAGWWDARCAAMPIVLPPTDAKPRWRMFYYGREGAEWNGGLPAFLPTGVSGVAESEDGLSWSRIRGPLEGGSILRPSEDPAAFDHVHLGMTDVLVNEDDGSYTALYLGGSAEQVSLGMGPGPISGFKMRPAAATSADGISWERCGTNPLLDVGGEGEWDSNFASWPRALPVDPAKPGGRWLMTYHALQPVGAAAAEGDEGDEGDEAGSEAGEARPPTWAVGCAVSEGGPLGPWSKVGRVLEGGAEGAWDERGIGTRHVVHATVGGTRQMVMVYEGVGADGRHGLGLATSADGGLSWDKVLGLGAEPGGPILRGSDPAGEGAWDDGNIGTPWLVHLPDGRWRLYYVGTSDKGRTVAIGAAESDELFSCDWTRVEATC